MTTRRRYILLVFCIALFTLLAPALVLYVRGQEIDDATGRIVDTGIVSVYTQPTNAEVYIDGELTGQTQLSARFITAGQHTIEVQSDKTHVWKKQLFVEAGRVTRIGTRQSPVRLLAISEPKIIAEQIKQGASIGKDNFTVLKNDQLQIWNLDLEIEKHFGVPNGTTTAFWNNNGSKALLYAANTTYLLDTSTEKSHKISLAVSADSMISFEKNRIIFLENNALKVFSLQTSASTPLLDGVLAATQNGNTFYALKNTTNSMELWAGTADAERLSPLITGLPTFHNAEIFVTNDKQALILAESKLYQVDNTLKEVANNITDAQLTNAGLLLYSQHELRFYDVGSRSLQLVLRSTEKLGKSLDFASLGYIVVQRGTELLAIELDTRDIQQNYKLADVNNITNIWSTPDNKWIYWVDSGNLKRIQFLP